MAILSMSFAVFMCFLLISVWFGLIKRGDLPTNGDNRASLRMAGLITACSGLMSLLLVVGVSVTIALVLVAGFIIGVAPLYQTIVQRMEGID